MISFLLDENIPYSLIDFLERREYKVYHIRKLGKSGIRNGEVYQLAVDLSAWIVTRDKDFRSHSKFLRYKVPGIIILESEEELTRVEVVREFDQFLKTHADKLNEKQLIVLNAGTVRTLFTE